MSEAAHDLPVADWKVPYGPGGTKKITVASPFVVSGTLTTSQCADRAGRQFPVAAQKLPGSYLSYLSYLG